MPAHTRSLGCKVLAQSSPSHHHHHQFALGAWSMHGFILTYSNFRKEIGSRNYKYCYTVHSVSTCDSVLPSLLCCYIEYLPHYFDYIFPLLVLCTSTCSPGVRGPASRPSIDKTETDKQEDRTRRSKTGNQRIDNNRGSI